MFGLLKNLGTNLAARGLEKIAGAPDKIAGAANDVMNPANFMRDKFNNTITGALVKDPADFDRIMLEMSKTGEKFGTPLPEMLETSAPTIGMPSQGFIGQMPNFLNTDQLILNGGLY